MPGQTTENDAAYLSPSPRGNMGLKKVAMGLVPQQDVGAIQLPIYVAEDEISI
jgi:hypothetical protein